MTPPRIWKEGERVRVKHEERDALGSVALVAGDGLALMLTIDGVKGSMAIGWLAGGWVGLQCGHPVDLTESPPVDPPAPAP